jgi:hypothetical protein
VDAWPELGRHGVNLRHHQSAGPTCSGLDLLSGVSVSQFTRSVFIGASTIPVSTGDGVMLYKYFHFPLGEVWC